MDKLLKFDNFVWQYSNGQRIGPINFDLSFRETFALVGGSGAGKSTVAFAVLNLLKFKEGKRAAGNLELNVPYEKIAYIPQDPAAAFDPLVRLGDTVKEMGLSWDKVCESLNKLYLSVGKINAKSYACELSGGMAQRLLIAIAVARESQLIIADEPTSSLDVIHQAEAIKMFEILNDSGIAILFVTHHLPLATRLCKKILVMNRGEIVDFGNVKDIYENPKSDWTKQLLRAVPPLEF